MMKFLKMISSSRGEEELPTKQEGGIVNDKVATSSRLWSGLSNPRIVRVSRAFGGKDRHSKVSTVRGLRDRRVRLSVPTAIQLYDLQERLGLNQPSKVVDWLLNAAQNEIDKLPPLPMPPGNFFQFSQSLEIPRESTPPQSSSHSSMIGDANEARARSLSFLFSKPTSKAIVEQDLETLPKAAYWNSDTFQGVSQRDAQREIEIEKDNFIRINEVETHDASLHSSRVVAHDPDFRTSYSFFSGLLSNNMPYSSYHNSETSNAYASQLGVHPSQMEVPSASITSSLSLAPGSHLMLCSSGSSIPQMFPQHITASTGMDERQFGQYQMATLASQDFLSHPMRTYLHSNMTSKPHHSQDNHES